MLVTENDRLRNTIETNSRPSPTQSPPYFPLSPISNPESYTNPNSNSVSPNKSPNTTIPTTSQNSLAPPRDHFERSPEISVSVQPSYLQMMTDNTPQTMEQIPNFNFPSGVDLENFLSDLMRL